MKLNKKIAGLVLLLLFINSFILPVPNVLAAEDINGLSTVQESSTRPQDDFYEAVNEEWENSAINNINELYGEKSTYNDIRENNDKIVKEEFDKFILNKYKYGQDSDERKMADVYSNYINVEARNKAGIQPIQQYLDSVDKANSIKELNNTINNNVIDMLDNIIIFNIQKNFEGTGYEVYIEPTYLTLLDSDKYLENDKTNEDYKEKFTTLYMNLLKKCGYTNDESQNMIDNLFKFESAIAPSILSIEEESSGQLDQTKYNVKITLSELDKLAPNINMSNLMNSLKIGNARNITIKEPEWLKALNELWTEENLPLLKDYIKINIIESTGKYLTTDMSDEYYKFVESLVNVDCSYSSINDEAYSKVNNLFPISMGKLYCERAFTEAEKNDVESLYSEIINAYKEKIMNCDWMEYNTKINIVDKLNKIRVNIGYYNSNQDYSNADIKLYSDGGGLFENIINLATAAKDNQIKELNNVLDKNMITDQIIPQDVIAEYHTLSNLIIITPGILQPELYDINFSREKKLATVGIIIAHEISHSLDILGAFFDGDGNIKNLWSNNDFEKYKVKALRIIDYYNVIEVLPGKYVNGDQTLCENMADLGAMSCMLKLMSETENADYKEFFEEYARAYKSIKKEESYELALEMDEHSPDKVRVNAVLTQFDEFYNTYGIVSGDGMYLNPKYRNFSLW